MVEVVVCWEVVWLQRLGALLCTGPPNPFLPRGFVGRFRLEQLPRGRRGAKLISQGLIR